MPSKRYSLKLELTKFLWSQLKRIQEIELQIGIIVNKVCLELIDWSKLTLWFVNLKLSFAPNPNTNLEYQPLDPFQFKIWVQVLKFNNNFISLIEYT